MKGMETTKPRYRIYFSEGNVFWETSDSDDLFVWTEDVQFLIRRIKYFDYSPL